MNANQATTYTKTEFDNNWLLRANQSTTYTETEVDNSLALNANQSTTYTKTEVDNSLAIKAPMNSPTFTGTVSGIAKAMVQLRNVDNTSDLAKPISTATQIAQN